jgi:predicted nucleic acid-binding protein
MLHERRVMRNSPICVDASFVVTLLLNDESPVHMYWQTWLQEQRTVLCPGLLAFEVVNALHQQWRHMYLSAATTQHLINVLNKLPIQVQSHPELHLRATALAETLKLGATYDAHYVALAQLYDGELWTCDARLQRRFAETTYMVHLAA